jgi:hypothetical protein
VQNRAAIIAGGVAAAAAVAYGLLRRRPATPPPAGAPEESPGPDPRAEVLREKLAASRELAGERDAFEEAETPVDEAVAAESDEDVEEHRRAVHERGRAVADEMRHGSGSGSGAA